MLYIKVFKLNTVKRRSPKPPVTFRYGEAKFKSPPVTAYQSIPLPSIVKSVPNTSTTLHNIQRTGPLLESRQKEFRSVVDLCDGLFKNRPSAQREAVQFRLFKTSSKARGETMKLSEKLDDDCQKFLSHRNYWDFSPTKEEQEFPIAFSLLVYRDGVQVERLLRAIYMPHNFYCIHVDEKASRYMHLAMAGLARCLHNVYVVPNPLNVAWGSIDLVYAELMCVRLLLQRSSNWKYYINLTGQEYPLWSNRHIVRILKSFKGANDITASTQNVFHSRFLYSWENGKMTNRKKTPAPGGLQVIRGTAHAIANRKFMEAVIHEQLAIDFLSWLGDTFVPDEMFFPTLNHNSRRFNITGVNPEDSRLYNPQRRGSVARFKEWFVSNSEASRTGCRGFLQRGICVQGSRDLWKFKSAKQLFVNKVMMYRDPYAFKCLEYLHHKRSVVAYSEDEFDFDIDYYENLPFVRHHV